MTDGDQVGVASRAMRQFVGRERELDEFGAALQAALGGRGQLLLVSGEAGIGKTTLTDRFDRMAREKGFQVAWGRTWQAGGAPAFWPWSEVVAQLLGPAGLGHLSQDPLLGPLAQLLPDGAAAPPSARVAEAHQAQFQLFQAVRLWLSRRAQEQPIALFLEDLHAADRSTLLLLESLAASLRSLRVLVVGTYREVEARVDVELSTLLAQIGRNGTHLPLGRLKPEDALRWLKGVVPDAQSDVAERLLQRAGGNPLFLDELARRFAADPDGFRTGQEPLPHGVLQVIQERLRALPKDVYSALQLASVCGDEFYVTTLQDALGAQAQALEPMIEHAARLAVLAPPRDQSLRFVHALYREALYETLALSERQAVHRRIAEGMQTRYRDSPGDLPAAELAHHALEAGPDLLEIAVRQSIRAAAIDESRTAYDDALSVLARARKALERSVASPPLGGELSLAEGETMMRVGRVAEGRKRCLDVAELAQRTSDAMLLARAALAHASVLTVAVVDPNMVALLEQALDALNRSQASGSEHERLQVRVTARLASATQPGPNPARSIELARSAIASARELGDEATLLDAMHTGLAAMMDFVDARERIPLNQEVGQLATKLNDPFKRLRSLARLVFDYTELGEFAAAAQQIDEYDLLARELRLDHLLWRSPVFRSMLALARGNFDESDRLQEVARDLAGADAEARRCLIGHRHGRLRAQERLDEVLESFRQHSEFTGIGNEQAWASGVRAHIASRQEDVETARTQLAEVPRDSWTWVGDPPALCLMGEPVALVGDRERGEALYEQLLPVSGRDVSWGMFSALWEGPADRVLGLLAESLGRIPAAIEHFEAALARARSLGTKPYLCRTGYEYARMLLRSGNGEHAPRAREVLDETREIAEQLGLEALLPRIAALREPPRVDPSSADSAAPNTNSNAPSFRLVQEGEFWSLLWEGPPGRFKDSRGLRILSRLLAEPEREIHARELAGGEPSLPPASNDDAGEHLDEQSRAAYKTRLDDLRSELDEATEFNDVHRAERLRVEMEFLEAELARAIGLGGRPRRAKSTSERARVAVQRRLKSAIERIEAAIPSIGEHLQSTVHTGTFCVYRPSAPRRRGGSRAPR